jgi:hypothetical protein
MEKIAFFENHDMVIHVTALQNDTNGTPRRTRKHRGDQPENESAKADTVRN